MYKASIVDCFRHQLRVLGNEKRDLLASLATIPVWANSPQLAELVVIEKEIARIEQRWGAYLVRTGQV